MNKLWSRILEHPADPLAVADIEHFHVLSANRSFLRELQREEEECISRSLFDLLGIKADVNALAHIRRNLLEHGMTWDDAASDRYIINLQLLPAAGGNQPICLVRLDERQDAGQLERYSMLIEQSVAGVFQSEVGGSLLNCNDAFARMLGYPDKRGMLKNSTKSFYFTEADRDVFLADLRRMGQVKNYEIRLRAMDGREIWCLENTYLTRTRDGKEIISGTIIDITALKKAEQTNRENEERLGALARISHESVVFFSDSEIIDCNEQFANLFGYLNRRELIGMDISAFFTPPDLKKLMMAMDISSSNRTEIRTFNREGQLIILEVSGIYVHLHGHLRRVFVISDLTARKKSEFTLEQTVLRLRNVLENSPNAIFICTDGRIRYTNQAALDLLGVSFEDDVFDRPMLDYVEQSFVEATRQDIRMVEEGAEADYREIRIMNASGESVDVGMKCTLTVFENKPSVQVSLTNISERMQLMQEQMRVRIIEEINTVLKKEIEEHKRTQKRLEAQQAYTRNLIESSLDMIIACDKEDRIIEFNRAAQEMFGYSREEIMGENIAVLYARPSDRKKVVDVLGQKGQFFGEIPNKRRDGTVFPSLLSASLIRDSRGKISGSMGVSRDITEYRENERRALEQKAKLESIFNSTENMMMWTMDRNNRATTINANFIRWVKDELSKQVSPGDEVRQLLLTHVDVDLYQNQLDAFELAFDGRPQQFELPLKVRDKRKVWLQVFLNPVYLDGRLEEVSALVYDVTDRKLIDRRIREALREKEVLLKEIHHRVKNNLQVISSILNLQSSYVHDSQTLDILRESQNRIKSMSFIHETLYRTTDFSNIDFSEYLRILSNNLIQSYRLSDCEVKFHPELDELNIHIDQAIPCGLIVNELISNALKYAFTGRPSGNLHLSLRRVGRKVKLSVSDDGRGLPEGFMHEKTDSLGIQLVYTLTEQLDGTIDVSSRPGKGTRFLITFEMMPV